MSDVAAAAAAEGSGEDSLRDLLKEIRDAHRNLPSMNPQSPNYRDDIKALIRRCDTLATLVRHAALFSKGESYTEHSTETLEFVLLGAIRAEFVSRDFSPATAPDRDETRLVTIQDAIQTYNEFLEECISLEFEFAQRDMLEYYLTLPPHTKRDREAKIAHMQALKTCTTTLKELDERVQGMGHLPPHERDEDVQRQCVLASVHASMLRACDAIEMLVGERDLLKDMIELRKTGKGMGAGLPAMRSDARAKPAPPLVLTSDAVKDMAKSGKSVRSGNVAFHFHSVQGTKFEEMAQMARSKFELTNEGYGPIGAPTRTLDEQIAIDIKEGMIIMDQQNGPKNPLEELDPDSYEADEIEVYKKRAFDEYKDDHKRGSGNKIGMG